MFWKKATQPAPEARSSASPAGAGADSQIDHALDTIVSMLRSFGSDAFDTDTALANATRSECEAWAQRITFGPGKQDEDAAAGSFRRDWGGLRRYFSTQRAHERDYVGKSFQHLREAVQAFARCLTTAVGEERSLDMRLGSQLGRLVQAFQENDPAVIRSEAEGIAGLVQEVMERRRERQAQQIAMLSDKIQVLKDELQHARELAALDPLTQLYNRQALDAHVERVSDLAFLLSSSPCLLMIDVDHFKTSNVRYGHTTGDDVLKRIADSLVRQFLRREDFVARFGGEEFVVVIPDSSLQNARKRAERVRETIEELEFSAESGPFHATISIGISSLAEGDDGRAWLRRADAALYDAKAAGRNAVRVSPFPRHSVASLRPSE